MEATKDHISLETAKLLKNCGIESEYYFYNDEIISNELFYKIYNEHKAMGVYGRDCQQKMLNICYPAYTWQEILWEYPEEFFGGAIYDVYSGRTFLDYHSCEILRLLREKCDDEADQYFRENCILTKQTPMTKQSKVLNMKGGEEVEEIPVMKGTQEALDKIVI